MRRRTSRALRLLLPARAHGQDRSSRQRPPIGNDRFVLDVLAGKRNGYFVEAGALDGLVASNTLLLEREYGWTGVCVEADPELFEELRTNRSCICENVCLYDFGGEVEFVAGVRGWGGVPEHLAESKRIRWSKGRTIRVPALPLAQLLDRCASPAVIDYLSLDTEGTELTIPKNFPFDRFRFRVISVEGGDCDGLLAAMGYRRVPNRFNTSQPGSGRSPVSSPEAARARARSRRIRRGGTAGWRRRRAGGSRSEYAAEQGEATMERGGGRGRLEGASD